jgi:hypothetical protein
MANTSRPNGLRPVATLNGAPWNGQVNQYLIPSTDGTAVYVGDLVKSGGTAGAAGVVVNGQDVEGMPTVARCAAGDTARGVVVGFLPNQSDLTILHRVASTNRIALVVDDPNVVFEIEEDALGAALAAADVGENADVVATAGSSTTGQSGMVLDSSDHKTATAQLRILGFVKRADNAIGANAKVLVLINEHEFKSTSGV